MDTVRRILGLGAPAPLAPNAADRVRAQVKRAFLECVDPRDTPNMVSSSEHTDLGADGWNEVVCVLTCANRIVFNVTLWDTRQRLCEAENRCTIAAPQLVPTASDSGVIVYQLRYSLHPGARRNAASQQIVIPPGDPKRRKRGSECMLETEGAGRIAINIFRSNDRTYQQVSDVMTKFVLARPVVQMLEQKYNVDACIDTMYEVLRIMSEIRFQSDDDRVHKRDKAVPDAAGGSSDELDGLIIPRTHGFRVYARAGCIEIVDDVCLWDKIALDCAVIGDKLGPGGVVLLEMSPVPRLVGRVTLAPRS